MHLFPFLVLVCPPKPFTSPNSGKYPLQCQIPHFQSTFKLFETILKFQKSVRFPDSWCWSSDAASTNTKSDSSPFVLFRESSRGMTRSCFSGVLAVLFLGSRRSALHVLVSRESSQCITRSCFSGVFAVHYTLLFLGGRRSA